MSFYAQAVQAMLDEFKWDQRGYLVQPDDVHNQLWNLLSYLDFMHADIYGGVNGVITGLNVTASTPNMAFAISSGRCTTLAGQKIIGLVTPGGSGQPATFTVNPTNGVAIILGQTRIDLICAQYAETTYQDANGADRIIEGITLTVLQGTAAVTPVAPSLPDSSYTALAAITVHSGDVSAAQCTLDTTAAGLRYNFPSLVSLLSTITSLNYVALQGNAPTPQVGQGGVKNVSINGFLHTDQYVEYAYITTPAAPAANSVKVYYKSDGNRYVYDPVYGEQLDIPIGKPEMWLSGTLPAGCFWLDGSVFNSVNYARLAAILAGRWKTGGETATQDRLPDARGRTWFGADSFGSNGATTRLSGAAAGATGGAQSIIQTLLQLVAHTHSDLGHGHGVNDGGHGHGVNDPGHDHVVTAEEVDASNHNLFGWFIGERDNGAGSKTTSAATTGITINAGTSGITIQNGVTNIQNAGSGNSMNVMNPFVVGTGWIIRY